MCEKKPFNSDNEARSFSKWLARQRGGKKQRSYFCEDCKKWHLSTGNPKYGLTGDEAPQKRKKQRPRDISSTMILLSDR